MYVDVGSKVFEHRQHFLPFLINTYLKHNQLQTLELYLYNNKIAYLPSRVFSHLKNLGMLSLYFNRLQIINSDSFGDLPNLKTVRLDINRIEAIDEAFFSNTGITYLNMTFNACANEYISDTTTSKYTMKLLLNQCIENYEEIMAGKYFGIKSS